MNCHITINRTETGRYVVTLMTTIEGEPQSYFSWFYDSRTRASLAASLLEMVYKHDMRKFVVTMDNRLQQAVS
jgi:hypothetical protein